MPRVAEESSKAEITHETLEALQNLQDISHTALPLESLQRPQFIATIVPSLPESLRDPEELAGRLSDAVESNNAETITAFRNGLILLRMPFPAETRDIILEGFEKLSHGENIRFQNNINFALGLVQNNVTRSMRAWSPEDQMEFAPYLHSNLNMEYFSQLSYFEQLRVYGEVFDRYCAEHNIEMSRKERDEFVISAVAAMVGGIRGADAQTMDNVLRADGLDAVLSAATYLTFSDREAIGAFTEGPAEGPVPASAAEQFAAMLDAYFEISKDFFYIAFKIF